MAVGPLPPRAWVQHATDYESGQWSREWSGFCRFALALAASPAPPNSRCSPRFSRYSSPMGAIRASRQEWQIVQSSLDLGDFLPGFTSPLRQL